MITDLEPDILECEVKWALESITTNKASGGDGIPVELFQILKDDAVNVLHSICRQIWKTQQWPQDWKMSVFIPIPKKGNAKECSNHGLDGLKEHAFFSHSCGHWQSGVRMPPQVLLRSCLRWLPLCMSPHSREAAGGPWSLRLHVRTQMLSWSPVLMSVSKLITLHRPHPQMPPH